MANEIYIARQDTLESVKDTVESIDTNVGTPDFAGGGTDVLTALAALRTEVEALKTLVGSMGSGGLTSCIKSIQTGVTEIGDMSTVVPSDLTVNINTVDPNKTVILLKDANVGGSSEVQSYLVSKAATSFVIRPSYYSTTINTKLYYRLRATQYQVIEFC